MNINSAGAELFHVDGQTDRRTDRYDEVNNRFSKTWRMSLNTAMALAKILSKAMGI